MLSYAVVVEGFSVRSRWAHSSAHASTAPMRRTTAAALAMILGSMIFLRRSVEHLHGLRLIALPATEEAAELLACLLLIGGGASAGETLRP
jgi:hypothetical protein